MRKRIKDTGHGECLDERINRACKVEEDNGETAENSVFYVSRSGWYWCLRQIRRASLERFPDGHRVVMPTWFGVVYIVADKLLGEFDESGNQTLEVEWGDSMTYEECIRQGELWMARADAKKPPKK